jgi:hypothetical protein
MSLKEGEARCESQGLNRNARKQLGNAGDIKFRKYTYEVQLNKPKDRYNNILPKVTFQYSPNKDITGRRVASNQMCKSKNPFVICLFAYLQRDYKIHAEKERMQPAF